jgi:hypothetical protein
MMNSWIVEYYSEGEDRSLCELIVRCWSVEEDHIHLQIEWCYFEEVR